MTFEITYKKHTSKTLYRDTDGKLYREIGWVNVPLETPDRGLTIKEANAMLPSIFEKATAYADSKGIAYDKTSLGRCYNGFFGIYNINIKLLTLAENC